MNTGDLWPSLDEARMQVLGIQTKLHQWSNDDDGRRFGRPVRRCCRSCVSVGCVGSGEGNRGARSAGVSGVTARSRVSSGKRCCTGCERRLKASSFEPLQVKEQMIQRRRASSGVWASLRSGTGLCRPAGDPFLRRSLRRFPLLAVSTWVRPLRRLPGDISTRIHFPASNRYEWVLEGDIEGVALTRSASGPSGSGAGTDRRPSMLMR